MFDENGKRISDYYDYLTIMSCGTIQAIKVGEAFYNKRNQDGTLFCKEFYKNNILMFGNNYAIRVILEDGSHNLMTREGKLLSEKWFYEVGPWVKGGAEVTSEFFSWSKYLKKDGTLLLQRGLPQAILNQKFNVAYNKSKIWVISIPEYEIVSEIECDYEKSYFINEGIKLINKKGKYNILSKETGKLFWDTWKEWIMFMATCPYIVAVERRRQKTDKVFI